MSETTFDLRGLSCPEPVLRARTHLQAQAPGTSLIFRVDTATSRDNVVRTLRRLGQDPAVEERDEEFWIRLQRR